MSVEISVVIPLFNEEGCVEELHRRLGEALGGLKEPYEIVVVDDGSTDKTFTILTSLAHRDPHLRAIRFRRNFGQTAAMQAGIDYARGEIVVTMDGDLQNDPSDIPHLTEKLREGYDLVCGWRKRRHDGLLLRKVPSRVANWLIGRLTGIWIHDTGCSLKAFRRSLFQETRLYSDMHRFIPALLSLSGVRYVEVPVRHHPRKYGKSKYGLSRIWKVVLDLLTLKMLTSFVSRPAVWFVTLSVPFALLGAAALIAAALSAFTAEGSVSIVPLGVAFVSFASLSHMCLLGCLGELVRRLEATEGTDLPAPGTVEVLTPEESARGRLPGSGARNVGDSP